MAATVIICHDDAHLYAFPAAHITRVWSTGDTLNIALVDPHPHHKLRLTHVLDVSPARVNAARQVALAYIATSLDQLVAEQANAFTGKGLNLGTVGTIDARLAALHFGEFIHELPPRDRLMVQLRFGHDMTQRQISQLLGISQMQVSRLLSAVMTRLRATLSDGIPHPS